LIALFWQAPLIAEVRPSRPQPARTDDRCGGCAQYGSSNALARARGRPPSMLMLRIAQRD
jgi:hypothetical protein